MEPLHWHYITRNSKGGCFTLLRLLCAVYGCYLRNISNYEAPDFSSVFQKSNEGNYTSSISVNSSSYKHLSEEEKGFSTDQKCNASFINIPVFSCGNCRLGGPLNEDLILFIGVVQYQLSATSSVFIQTQNITSRFVAQITLYPLGICMRKKH